MKKRLTATDGDDDQQRPTMPSTTVPALMPMIFQSRLLPHAFTGALCLAWLGRNGLWRFAQRRRDFGHLQGVAALRDDGF